MEGGEWKKERPIGDWFGALRPQKTVQINFLEKDNCVPFKITSQCFYGGEIKIKSKVSSHFASSILVRAPYAQKLVKEGEKVKNFPSEFYSFLICFWALCANGNSIHGKIWHKSQ